jgi:predicted lipid-binding transport protein (Tim44 family)
MSTRKRIWTGIGSLALAGAMTLALFAAAADARTGGGRSFGSRGERTFQRPPTTNTAPKAAAPVEKSITSPGKPSAVAQAPNPAAGAATQASRFGGWRGLLMGGLIGAALASIFGLGALASVLGFLLQFALIALVVWLVISFFRSRRAQPAMVGAGAGLAGGRPQANTDYRQAAGMLGGGTAGVLTIKSDDYDAFERLLGEIQDAYGRNDLDALGERTTPEMLSYFAADLAADAKAGRRNEVGEAKLLQGDLAEAWREASGEYATVAMRFSLIDAMVDAASGDVLSGSRTSPQEVTEVWTFRRPPGGSARQWELSAIQQA